MNKKQMGPLHEAVTWYKICHAGWQATQWDIKNKEKSRLAGGNRFVLEAVAFFCHPAWRIVPCDGIMRRAITCGQRATVFFPLQSAGQCIAVVQITGSKKKNKFLQLFTKYLYRPGCCALSV